MGEQRTAEGNNKKSICTEDKEEKKQRQKKKMKSKTQIIAVIRQRQVDA